MAVVSGCALCPGERGRGELIVPSVQLLDRASLASGNVMTWWGEAADEPASPSAKTEDARPTAWGG
jgi:hypothetical protein